MTTIIAILTIVFVVNSLVSIVKKNKDTSSFSFALRGAVVMFAAAFLYAHGIGIMAIYLLVGVIVFKRIGMLRVRAFVYNFMKK